MPGRGNGLSEGSEVGLRGPTCATQLTSSNFLPAPDCDLGRQSVRPPPHGSLSGDLQSRMKGWGKEGQSKRQGWEPFGLVSQPEG